MPNFVSGSHSIFLAKHHGFQMTFCHPAEGKKSATVHGCEIKPHETVELGSARISWICPEIGDTWGYCRYPKISMLCSRNLHISWILGIRPRDPNDYLNSTMMIMINTIGFGVPCFQTKPLATSSGQLRLGEEAFCEMPQTQKPSFAHGNLAHLIMCGVFG